MMMLMLAKGRKLSTQILFFQALILGLTLLVGFVLALHAAQARIDDEALQRGAGIARAVAVMPDIVQGLERQDRSGIVQRRAEEIRQATHVESVVIADRRGIRYAHPVPERLFTPVSVDPSVPLSGREQLVVNTGSLGRGARARVPIRDDEGRVIGMAAVTVLQRSLRKELSTAIPVIALYTGIALAIGLAASMLLARVLKRQTFGLELGEIAGLLREREAMLRGIREGVVAIATDGTIALVNAEAKRLLNLPDDVAGRPAESVAVGRLGDVLSGRVAGEDLLLMHGDRRLVASRMPVRRQGRDLGAVVTFRDRTELESLARELDSFRGLTDAMRAQAHEFSNRLHTITGLLRLGHEEEALEFIDEITEADAELRQRIADSVADSRLAALLLAKSTVAAERGVELRLGDGLRLTGQLRDVHGALTILGNLIDNALDAARQGVHDTPWIEVWMHDEPDGDLKFRVADSGRGVEAADRDRIFEFGFSTKPSSVAGEHGVGLALVRRTVERRGGSIDVVCSVPAGGAIFTVWLPEAVRHRARVATA